MKPYESITREVDRSRKGPATAAFFDFDGTLLHRVVGVDYPDGGLISLLQDGGEWQR